MNERERLIKIITETPCVAVSSRIAAEHIADNLLANGVTVKEWIPVTERLPEKNTSVLVSTDNGIVFQCLYAYDGWDLWEGNEVNITHWQPMPQPPKEEE